jgi:S1-C subfamily serine protease
MQDDQRNGGDQVPEESGSAPEGAEAAHQPDLSDAEPAQPSPQPGDAQPGGPSGPGSESGRPFFAQPGYGQTAPLGHPGEHGSNGPGGYGPGGTHGYEQGGYGPGGPGGYGPGGYGPGGYGPGGYGPGGYGHSGFGQSGYGPGGYGPGGYGQGGYYPEPGSRARRRRTLLTYLTVAVVAAAIGAGLTGYALNSNQSAPSSAGGAPRGGAGNPGDFPGFPSGGNSARHSVNSPAERSAVSAVRPGLVQISSTLSYQGSQAAATGMVISNDGLVLTNNHVITDTTKLYATVLASNKRYTAKWLGYDSTDDVAVIKLIGAHNLRTVPLGDSNTVQLGDKVIAIGNAYGAGRFPAVVGKITGKDRTITAGDSGAATKETLHGMLQTNAGIVQGDSGGPLANISGKVIGMNTAAATGSFGDSTENVGFAIPINKALHIARQIISGKSSPQVQIGSTGFLGVLVPAGQASTFTDPQQQRQRQIKQDQGSSGFPVQPAPPVCLQNQEGAGVPAHVAPVPSGALIIGELCGTPADTHGIIAGDVITSVGGHKISSPKQLTSVMLKFKPGESVQVTWADVHGQSHTDSLDLVQAPPR